MPVLPSPPMMNLSTKQRSVSESLTARPIQQLPILLETHTPSKMILDSIRTTTDNLNLLKVATVLHQLFSHLHLECQLISWRLSSLTLATLRMKLGCQKVKQFKGLYQDY